VKIQGGIFRKSRNKEVIIHKEKHLNSYSCESHETVLHATRKRVSYLLCTRLSQYTNVNFVANNFERGNLQSV